MMKKRSMAIAMASTMIATTVAPVVANAATNEEVRTETIMAKNSAKLVSEVREKLNTKYTGTEECVYEIKSGETTITTATQLSNLINELAEGEDLVVTIKDKGHETVDGKIVSQVVPKFTVSEVVALTVSSTNDKVVEKVTVSDAAVATVKLKETGKELTFKAGSEKVDFSKPIDVNDKEVSLVSGNTAPDSTDSKYTTADDEGNTGEDHKDYIADKAAFDKSEAEFLKTQLKKIVGFEKVEKSDIHSTPELIAEITVTNSDIQKTTADKLYDGLRLTSQGKELLDYVQGTKTFEEDGKEYNLEAEAGEVKTVKEDEKYTMDIKLAKKEVSSRALSADAFMTITVEGSDEDNLKELAEIINNKEAQINVLAGDSRYTTAVEISKELRKDSTKVDGNAVVLVNSSALVDGLAATPFATAVKGSVLLTDKASVPTATLDEVKEVLDYENSNRTQMKSKTIYLVGGTSVISPAVEKELEFLGANIVRIAGDDRHETSVKVAEMMNKKAASKVTNAFVVGATGEADAMSIASQAARTNSPIIVNGFNGLSEDGSDFLKDLNIDIIGGEKAVNTTVEAELKALDKDEKVERVAGETRHETNAKVINKYFTTTLTNVLVAKDGYAEGNDKLVDALAAGPLAAAKNAPVVLATKDLSVDQDEVLDLRLGASAKVYQAGNGVELNVIQKIAKKLGLK